MPCGPKEAASPFHDIPSCINNLFLQRGTSEPSHASPEASLLRTTRQIDCRGLNSKDSFSFDYRVSRMPTAEYSISISTRSIKSCPMPVPFARCKLWSTLFSYFCLLYTSDA